MLFSGARGKMIREKTWSKKSCDTVPLKQNITAHMNAYHFTKLYKNIENNISLDYPFKKKTTKIVPTKSWSPPPRTEGAALSA